MKYNSYYFYRIYIVSKKLNYDLENILEEKQNKNKIIMLL
jgi:hypothetical protein